eukprot:7103599-Prymnesium_polylepis.1
MASAAEVHAMRISQRAAEEARKGTDLAATAVPMSPRSRLESFRAEQNLRASAMGGNKEVMAEEAAAAQRSRLESFQARMPPSSPVPTGPGTAAACSAAALASAEAAPSIPALSLNGVAGGSSPATGAPTTLVRYAPRPHARPTEKCAASARPSSAVTHRGCVRFGGFVPELPRRSEPSPSPPRFVRELDLGVTTPTRAALPHPPSVFGDC